MFDDVQELRRSTPGGTVIARARFTATRDPTILKAAIRPGVGVAEQAEHLLRLGSPAWMSVVAAGRAGPALAEALGVPIDAPWYAMPVAPGRLLSSFEPPLPRDTWNRIAAQLLDALAHAHTRGVVHGDLKPANLWWDPVAGRLTLADPQPASGSGTPGWQAPELIDTPTPTAASDLHSAGLVLLWACLGTAVSPSPDGPEATRRLLEFWSVEAQTAAWLARLAATDPRDRPASAGDARDALPVCSPAPAPPGPRHPARISLGARLAPPAGPPTGSTPTGSTPTGRPGQQTRRPAPGRRELAPPSPGEIPVITAPGDEPGVALGMLRDHPLTRAAGAAATGTRRAMHQLLLASPPTSIAPWRAIGHVLATADLGSLRVLLSGTPSATARSLWDALEEAGRGAVRIESGASAESRPDTLGHALQEELRLSPESAQVISTRADGSWERAARLCGEAFASGDATWTHAGWRVRLSTARAAHPRVPAELAPGPGAPPPTPERFCALLASMPVPPARSRAIELARAVGITDPIGFLTTLERTRLIQVDARARLVARPAPWRPDTSAVEADRLEALLRLIPDDEAGTRAAIWEWAGEDEAAATAFLGHCERMLIDGDPDAAIEAWTRAATLLAHERPDTTGRLHGLLRAHELELLAAGWLDPGRTSPEWLDRRADLLIEEAHHHDWPGVLARALCVRAGARLPHAVPGHPTGAGAAARPASAAAGWFSLALTREARAHADHQALPIPALLARIREVELCLALGRVGAAADALQETLRMLSRDPGGWLPRGVHARVRLRLGDALLDAARWEEASSVLAQATADAETQPDGVSLAHGLGGLARAHLHLGRVDAARVAWERAFQLMDAMALPESRAHALALANLEAVAGDRAAAREWGRRAMHAAPPPRPPEPASPPRGPRTAASPAPGSGRGTGLIRLLPPLSEGRTVP